MTDEMNRAIRAAAGKEPPDAPTQSARVDSEPSDSNTAESPHSGSEAEPGVSDPDVLKAIAAHEEGTATGGRTLGPG
ncbi:MAG: hypothetical protein K0R88_142 [Solirubrobacterales bacterium]|jgi:hypothetical protein|nr:hypothetical protein [Solirubrobacterales bacterium]